MFSAQKESAQTQADEDLSAHIEGGLSHFPTLITEPWRVQILLEEEAIIQRYRLCFMLTMVRFFVTGVTLGAFVIAKHYDWVIISVMICYLFLVMGLQIRLADHKERIYSYCLLIGILDIILLGYLSFTYSTRLAISFLFLSIILSAMMLPLWRLLVVVLFAEIALCIGWLGFDSATIKSFFSVSTSLGLLHIKGLLLSMQSEALAMLLVGLVALAVIVNRLSMWSFQNDVKAKFRQKQMRQVLSFNRSVIEHLKSGVIVIGNNARVISINRRAVELMNLNQTTTVREIRDLSAELLRRYQYWMQTEIGSQEPYRHNDEAEEIFISFSGFGESGQRSVVMMTLESVNETLQQTQEAKLTALGRLTAGVAHEIRNPLSSINSAAQLLAETSQEAAHQKLSNVVLKNVKRTNQIITDILGLFKDTRAEREILPLNDTLKRFGNEFWAANKDQAFALRLASKEETPLYFLFDAGQFEQVLWNLVQNAIKYANVDDLQVIIRYRLSDSRRNIYIDVIDNGQGVDESIAGQIFEPFYTGGSGSGLGLYLVRELCSANNANIAYLPAKVAMSKNSDEAVQDSAVAKTGACFRITVQAYFSKNIKTK